MMPGMMVPPTMQPMQMGALSYLGQPLTAPGNPMSGAGAAPGGLPAGTPTSAGVPDIAALSAAYAMQGMQGMQGMVTSASMMHPNLFLNSDMSTGMPVTPSKQFCFLLVFSCAIHGHLP